MTFEISVGISFFSFLLVIIIIIIIIYTVGGLVWRSGSALVSINEVNLRRARLVLR